MANIEDEELHSRKKRRNRKGKLNENTANKALQMGADPK